MILQVIMKRKEGAAVCNSRCQKFVERINACQLLDMGSVGSRFTWRGPIYLGCRIFERLDRGLCNDHWRFQFPEAYLRVLGRLNFSDHHPLLIYLKGDIQYVAPKQFRFESAWLLEKSYNDMLAGCWNINSDISQNLVNFQREVKEWKWNTLDVLLSRKKRIMMRIEGIHKRLVSGAYNHGLTSLEEKLQNELAKILKTEELMWFQRSRAKWLADGDRNTRYYHLKTVNRRRRRNNVVVLRNSEGEWIDNPTILQRLVNDFYKNLFTNNNTGGRWFQTDVTYPQIDVAAMEKPVLPIGDEEVKIAF